MLDSGTLTKWGITSKQVWGGIIHAGIALVIDVAVWEAIHARLDETFSLVCGWSLISGGRHLFTQQSATETLIF